MDLEEWSNHIIGREKDGEGLPKHARKRVTIANELVALPKILFLDEVNPCLCVLFANDCLSTSAAHICIFLISLFV